MPETGLPTGDPSREEKQSRFLRFAEAIDIFPEEEKELARYHLDLYRQLDWRRHPEIYDSIAEFVQDLVAEKGDSTARGCKLFHLYVGSTLPENEWRKFPLDTPDRDFTNFAQSTLKPLIDKRQEQA